MKISLEGKDIYTLKPIDGGFHVRSLDLPEHSEACVHVRRMLFNWRLVRSIGPCDDPWRSGTDLYWCYKGTDVHTLLTAVAEAINWDGTSENPPKRWIKSYRGEVGDGETETAGG